MYTRGGNNEKLSESNLRTQASNGDATFNVSTVLLRARQQYMQVFEAKMDDAESVSAFGDAINLKEKMRPVLIDDIHTKVIK